MFTKTTINIVGKGHMKIIPDEKARTYTFVPVEQNEKDQFAMLIPLINEGDQFEYGGREDDGDYCIIHLYYGSTFKEVKEVNGNVTFIRKVREGGIHLVIKGTTKEDKAHVGALRNRCYFGSGRPFFIGTTDVDGVQSIVVVLKYCKICQAPLMDMREVEWTICNSCSDKCEHNYKRGLVHGGDAGSGAVGEFCDKCGKIKPVPKSERVKTDAENKVEVQRELGIIHFYTNTSLSAAEIVEREKAAGIIPAE